MSSEPLLATWLLDRCGADEGLVGDLIEQYRQRRSKAWFWREVAVAATVSCWRTVANHKWLALRAIATGWLVWFAYNVTLGGLLAEGLPRAAAAGGDWSWRVWTTYGGLLMTGVRYSGWIANGWIIGRLHRPYQTAMVLVYVAFSIVMCVPSLVTLLADTFGHPRYNPTPTGMALAILSLLVGGVLSAAPWTSPNCPRAALKV